MTPACSTEQDKQLLGYPVNGSEGADGVDVNILGRRNWRRFAGHDAELGWICLGSGGVCLVNGLSYCVLARAILPPEPRRPAAWTAAIPNRCRGHLVALVPGQRPPQPDRASYALSIGSHLSG